MRERRLLHRVSRHWPLLILLAAAVALRGLAWYAIQPASWFLGDSIDYVLGAVLRLPSIWRPGGYSFVLLLPLLPFHSLALVTAVQHLLGLATGLVVYALLVRFGLAPWLAAVSTAPALLDAYIVAVEQQLLSESLFTLLVVGAAAVLLWARHRPPPFACLVAGGLLGLAATTRTIGIALLPVFVVALAWRLGALRTAALLLAFSVPVALYVVKFDRTYHQPNLTLSSGVFLYGRTTQFVDCQRMSLPDDLRRLCPGEGAARRGELFYVFDSASPLRAVGDPAAADREALRFALAAIQAQPGGYAALVGGDLVHSLGAPGEEPLASNYQFAVTRPLPEQARQVGRLYQRSDPGPVYAAGPVAALAAYQRVASVPGSACLLALLVAAAGLLLGRDHERRHLSSAVLLTAGSALALLFLPVLTVAPDPRYRLPAIPLLCLAVPLSGLLLAGGARVIPWPSGELRHRSPD